MLNKKHFDYAEYVRKLYNFGNEMQDNAMPICREITFQITNSCNLCCSYCYEHHKGIERMSLETAKDIIDSLLDGYDKNDGFLTHKTKAVILSFIGGEPLLEAELIERIVDYWLEQCYIRKIPLAYSVRISFASNGQNWFSKEVQHLIYKYKELISPTISIDGVQELHDMHRIDCNACGSFEKAWIAFQDGKKYGWYNSKMTFVPDSFKYIFESVRMMIEEGCKYIACNYAYEPMYSEDDAKELYVQLKKLSDYIVDNSLDNVEITIIDDYVGGKTTSNRNYCGGTGNMLAYAPDGNAYPCVRYAPISVGVEKAEKMKIGDLHGLWTNPEQKELKHFLESITLESQSEQKCIDCPISAGCGWCSAYNYELYGTPNKRYTGICLAQKARVLATCYFYNKKYLQEVGECDPKAILLPREEVVRLIGQAQADELYKVERAAFDKRRLAE